MDITKLSVTELKALLWDLTQQGQAIQSDYNIVAQQLKKVLEAKPVEAEIVEPKAE
jgi:hypothetical protein